MSVRTTLGAAVSILGLGCNLLLLPVHAQEPSNPLEEIVVVSSGIAVPRRTIGASVEVISGDDIEDHGSVSLFQILSQKSAVGSSNSGGAGKTTTLRIRGEEGFRTLTLFDGIRLADTSTPQIGTLFEHILASNVGRVEILKGPQGLSYGADAGGVVNISSPRAVDDPEFSVDGEWGKFGSQRLNASVNGGSGNFDYYLGVADVEADGFNARAADAVLADDDGYENTTLHGRLGISLSESLRLELVHRNVAGESEYDGCFSGTTVHDCLSDYDQSASRIGLDYQGRAGSHSLSWHRSDIEREDFALGASAFGNEGTLERVEYGGSIRPADSFTVVFGADWEDIDADGRPRNNVGYYGELLSDFSDSFFVNVGARYDDNDDFGTHTSVRVSAAYLIPVGGAGELKLKSSYGTGFRAPSPFEVGYNFGPFAFPPAAGLNLEQEESEGWEAGLEFGGGDGTHFEVVYFDQDVSDAIVFDLAGFSGYLQDQGSSNSSGVEVSMDLTLLAGLFLNGNYTYNDTERPNGEQRFRRPRHLANLGLQYRALEERLRLNLFYRGARDAVDTVFGSAVPLPDFDLVDFSARYALNSRVEIYLRMENLFDEDYEEINGFFTAGRAAFAGVRLRY